MPPKLKVKGKKRGGKRKKKGKKKKKEKAVVAPPPLHHLTELYNLLREKIHDLKRTQNKARKKRLEGWYMTREMLNNKHDNEVYHDYLKEKMEQVQKLIEQIMAQLERERAEVDRLIKERMAEYDRKIGEYKQRMLKGEAELNDLKTKLLEFEPLIKKLAGLLARLKELEAQIPGAELEANIKTRHLKNQYLNERAKLHNHLEEELYKLITTCRSHLMPILSEHLHMMEYDNRCNRWDLSRLDVANFKFSQQKELLLEKRNNLNMEKGYLNLEWAFNKLAICEARKRDELEKSKQPRGTPISPEECELSIAFKTYLNDRLAIQRQNKEREARLEKARKAKQRKWELEQEKLRKQAEKCHAYAKMMREKKEEEEEEEGQYEEGDSEISEDEWNEMEYYEDPEGNLVMAPSGRMKQHKALMENKDPNEREDDGDFSNRGDDDADEWDDDKSSSMSFSSSFSSSGNSVGDDVVNVNADEEDYGQGDDDDDDDDAGDPRGAARKSKAKPSMSERSSMSAMSKKSVA